MKKLSFLSVMLLFGVQLTLAQTAGRFPSFDRVEDICYCAVQFLHPRQVVKNSNNYEILLALRHPMTLEELAATGIPHSENQILLLQSQRLIERDGNTYRTTIPILDSLQTSALRADSYETGKILVPEIVDDCRNLVEHLSSEGMPHHAFSLLFSYVLDGKIWKVMEKKDMITGRNKESHESWEGNYWILYNKRKTLQCGTNTMNARGKYSLKINWSDDLIRMASPLFSSKNLNAFLKEIDANNKVSEPSAFSFFTEIGVIRPDGSINIPIIEDSEANRIHVFAETISDKLTEALQTKIDIEAITHKYGFSDTHEAMVIFYHEVMWDILGELVERGVVHRPAVFASPQTAKLSDVRDLCFLLRENNE